MDFVCDIHVARKIVQALRNLGFESMHAFDIKQTDTTPDYQIAKFVDEIGACLITKDKLFRKQDRRLPPLTSPKKIITVDDMNSRPPQIILLLQHNDNKLREILSDGTPFSYLLDRFGGLHPSDLY